MWRHAQYVNLEGLAGGGRQKSQLGNRQRQPAGGEQLYRLCFLFLTFFPFSFPYIIFIVIIIIIIIVIIFIIIIELCLSQPTSSFALLILSPVPQRWGEWASSCVVLGCWLGLNHDNSPKHSEGQLCHCRGSASAGNWTPRSRSLTPPTPVGWGRESDEQKDLWVEISTV